MHPIILCQICGKEIGWKSSYKWYPPKSHSGECRSTLMSNQRKGKAPKNINSIKGWNKGVKMPEMSGDKNPAWKGGRTKHGGGYILVRHEGKQVLEHRLVMEKYIGRKLDRREIVHHKNHNKTDNRIENLELLTPTDHAKLHDIERGRDVHNRFKRVLRG